MQTLTIGAYRATLKPTRNVGEFTAKLAKCNGKSRRLPLRDLRTKAGFPVFEPGMSTAEYVRLYSSGDGSQLKAWEWAQLNDAPCTLYSGEDTCETLPDGFDTWEDFDAAQGSSTAAESAPADAEPVDATEPVAPDDAIAPAIVASAEPYPGCEPAAAIVYRVHLATAAHSRAIDPAFNGYRRPRSACMLADFAAPAVRAHRLAIARSVRAERAKRASLEARAARVPTERADDYRGAAAMLRADADAAPGIVPGFASRGARMLQAAIARSAARGIEVGAGGAPLATHSQSAAVADPLTTHSEPAPARPVYASDHKAWLDVENGRAEPDEYQARVIECFGEVKAGGLFYNSDTYPATAALMTARYGYPDWRGDRGQSDGVQDPFGMDCYRANCVIRARAERERERGAAATFTVGQRFARLIFNDGKQRTAAELVTFDPAGFACKLKAKSGRNSVEITCSAYALSLAVIRAEERGKVLASKRASARPEPIAPMPAEPAPVPSKSEPDPVPSNSRADAAPARYTLTVEVGRMRRTLSAVKHAPFSDAEMAAHASQWAIDNQTNPHRVAIAQACNGEPFSRRESNATVNAPECPVPPDTQPETAPQADPAPGDTIPADNPRDPAPVVEPYRYARGAVVARCKSPDDFKTRAARLAEHCRMRWVHRAGGYVGTVRQSEKLLRLFAEGRDASSITGELCPIEPAEPAPIIPADIIATVAGMCPIDRFDYLVDYTDAEPCTTAEKHPDSMRAAILADIARTGPDVFRRRIAEQRGETDDDDDDDDETIPAPLDGLDVAELNDLAEFERAGGIAQPIAPAYRDDAPRATPTPSLRISPSDPRARIPARFAPVYLLQA